MACGEVLRIDMLRILYSVLHITKNCNIYYANIVHNLTHKLLQTIPCCYHVLHCGIYVLYVVLHVPVYRLTVECVFLAYTSISLALTTYILHGYNRRML